MRFGNERLRVFADAMAQAYETAKRFVAEYDAQGMATTIPNTTDNVADGSDTDGRPRVTGQLVTRLYANAGAVIAWFEATPGGDTVPRITRFRQAAVNGGARF